MLTTNHTFLLKEKAKELGFTYCKVSRADFLHKEALQLERWLAKDYHGEMNYMEVISTKGSTQDYWWMVQSQ